MKKIAITQRVQVIPEIQERRDALSQEWARLAHSCGVIPVLLPNSLDIVQLLLNDIRIDGILLSGGNNLCSCGGDAPERDEVEHFLVEYSIKNRIPMLGVCRGMQLILEHFGTPLQPICNHVRCEHSLDNGDTVNSYHSFGANNCSPPLKALFHSKDGVIEAISHQDYPWIHGIMWHPERYLPFRERDLLMIKEMFQL